MAKKQPIDYTRILVGVCQTYADLVDIPVASPLALIQTLRDQDQMGMFAAALQTRFKVPIPYGSLDTAQNCADVADVIAHLLHVQTA